MFQEYSTLVALVDGYRQEKWPEIVSWGQTWAAPSFEPDAVFMQALVCLLTRVSILQVERAKVGIGLDTGVCTLVTAYAADL
jgi:hypothetical protein